MDKLEKRLSAIIENRLSDIEEEFGIVFLQPVGFRIEQDAFGDQEKEDTRKVWEDLQKQLDETLQRVIKGCLKDQG